MGILNVPQNKSDRYWASVPTEDLGKELERKHDFYYQFIFRTNVLSLWKSLMDKYYQGAWRNAGMRMSGTQGEYRIATVNDFRNIIQHVKVMATSQRLAYEARATNTDSKSIKQTLLAKQLLDYYIREKHIDEHLDKAVEYGLWAMEGWLRCVWNPTIGDPYVTNPDGTPVKTGDIEISTHHGIDIIRDSSRMDSDGDWYIVRQWKNRFDMAARFPEMRDKILAQPTFTDMRDWLNERFLYAFLLKLEDSDLIPVYEFYHKRTEAMPNGRFALWLGGELVPVDSSLPYERMPLFRISPSDWMGTPFGYSQSCDMAVIQEVLDMMDSSISTNQNAFGVQNVWAKQGSELNVTQLAGGLNLIKSPEKPEVLQLCGTPQEIFAHRPELKKDMERQAGINSVTRGEPEASLRSGNALALIQSMAIQFNQGLQASYARLAEDSGTHIIDMLKRYADAPRVATIVGLDDKPYLREFNKDDLSNISRVVIDLGNPLQRTIAGRVQMAETLMTNGLVKTPQEYLTVLETGKLEAMTRSTETSLILVKEENEALSAGQPVVATIIDDHVLHAREHRCVLDKLEWRNNPQVVAATLDHIQQHLNFMAQGSPLTQLDNPQLPQIVQQQAMAQQAAAMGMPPPGMPEAPQPSGQNPKGGRAKPAVSEQENAQNPAQAQAANIRPPSMPQNPLSKTKFDTQTGGMPQ